MQLEEENKRRMREKDKRKEEGERGFWEKEL